ncbi:MAG TPA: glycosyltransferase family 2 protein [Candidatus Binataceae bacterium]|nr:glycosyltransferase family 2 protein [Candidatus Binataceae bacterium]
MDISVVIPLFNERDNLRPLYEELSRVLASMNVSYEVLFVDDGSTDGSIDELRKIKTEDAHVRVVRLARNTGQTAGLQCGFQRSTGDVVVAIDSDGENDPADIPRLVERLRSNGNDLVSGWRTERWKGATFSRRIPSIAANRLISWMTGVELHDYGCTLKAYRGDLARSLMLYGEMHRFVPAIAAEQGARIAELEVGFRPRRSGLSKYGAGRILRTLLDLITVKFLSGYSTRPIQVFGLIGLVLAGLGLLWTTILIFEKLVMGAQLAARPALLLAVLLLVVGVQFVSIGLLGEMLARTYHESQRKPIYTVREEF